MVQNAKKVTVVFHYDRSLLFSSFVEVVCYDVIDVSLRPLNVKVFFRGAPLLWGMWSTIQCTE
jgi:hypothetical protein